MVPAVMTGGADQHRHLSSGGEGVSGGVQHRGADRSRSPSAVSTAPAGLPQAALSAAGGTPAGREFLRSRDGGHGLRKPSKTGTLSAHGPWGDGVAGPPDHSQPETDTPSTTCSSTRNAPRCSPPTTSATPTASGVFSSAKRSAVARDLSSRATRREPPVAYLIWTSKPGLARLGRDVLHLLRRLRDQARPPVRSCGRCHSESARGSGRWSLTQAPMRSSQAHRQLLICTIPVQDSGPSRGRTTRRVARVLAGQP
ncbi:hypothetical protein BZB76_0129 [Actinomadura pelletieri DSM 43383]|uniref:Uncharacterized protein n=1 Tax=Actinomadura pelletieri DSM 43383 TaxID=1120940 RepID=A0A495QWZ1_9ACTN|nr:hypothetical protein BZB76_0129 [Actinomadura pelletieri DSM 43383]